MSLDKAIEHGKEKRDPRRKRAASSCRNHGACGYCQGNRQHAAKKRIAKADYNERNDEE